MLYFILAVKNNFALNYLNMHLPDHGHRYPVRFRGRAIPPTNNFGGVRSQNLKKDSNILIDSNQPRPHINEKVLSRMQSRFMYQNQNQNYQGVQTNQESQGNQLRGGI